MLHSRLLYLLARPKNADNLAFKLVAAYPGLPFREEDFSRETYQGKLQEPVAEKVTRALAKSALSRNNPGLNRTMLGFIDAVLEKADCASPEWLWYRRGLLLTAQQDYKAALDSLLKVLSKKRSDSWIWAAIAANLETEAPDLAMAYYARALRASGKQEMLVKVYERLGHVASSRDVRELAAWAVENATRIREESGYTVPNTLKMLATELESVRIDVGSVRRHLAELASRADEHSYGRADRFKATYLSEFTSQRGAPLARLAFLDDGTSHVVVLPTSRLEGKFCPGGPVVIYGERNGFDIRAQRVVADPDRELWDSLEMTEGTLLVTRENQGDLTVRLEDGRTLLLAASVASEMADAEPGTQVEVMSALDRQARVVFAVRPRRGSPTSP